VTGWESSNRALSIAYQDSTDRRYFIVANKDPDPGKPTYKRELQLTGSAYCLEDIYTRDIFKANDSGIAKFHLPPAHGRVLKEKIGPAPFGFFDSLRIELEGTGVSVTMVAPDFVLSELHRRAGHHYS
jgi:hypothetical protein